ncbi:MAG TPA: dihydrofolate reductase family protein [Chitinophaga sp.]|uniref:dihydrofolate reductase family protein n=1 Tax=Chitinophaga sp. TaxID=1869181 RepID=UPI002DBA1F9F|nr:dihydrofolate reductase family protein [Chitinophaga sp.]HEU4554754.1 dihydrofolate reductase family protein [Chitinophaga sp.]
MKPYIVCHMLCSVDGRIQTEHWPYKSFPAYESTGRQEEADAWLCGRITMQQHFAAPLPTLASAGKTMQRIDYVANAGARSFAVAIDAHGKLGWDRPEIDGDHVITVLTEQVPDAYLAYLQQQGVSYIFGGRQQLNFSIALEKLNRLFNIQKIKLEGGGAINGAFHAEGLIDAYSILYFPIADGTSSPTVLDTDKKAAQLPAVPLRLIHLEQLEDGIIWARYEVVK